MLSLAFSSKSHLRKIINKKLLFFFAPTYENFSFRNVAFYKAKGYFNYENCEYCYGEIPVIIYISLFKILIIFYNI